MPARDTNPSPVTPVPRGSVMAAVMAATGAVSGCRWRWQLRSPLLFSPVPLSGATASAPARSRARPRELRDPAALGPCRDRHRHHRGHPQLGPGWSGAAGSPRKGAGAHPLLFHPLLSFHSSELPPSLGPAARTPPRPLTPRPLQANGAMVSPWPDSWARRGRGSGGPRRFRCPFAVVASRPRCPHVLVAHGGQGSVAEPGSKQGFSAGRAA